MHKGLQGTDNVLDRGSVRIQTPDQVSPVGTTSLDHTMYVVMLSSHSYLFFDLRCSLEGAYACSLKTSKRGFLGVLVMRKL